MSPIKTLDAPRQGGEDGETGEDISFREARAMGWLSKFFNSGKVEVSVDPALRERLRAQRAAAAGGAVETATEEKPKEEEAAEVVVDGVVRLESPVVGFWNLKGVEGAGMSKRDREVLGPMFPAGCRVSNGAAPVCDVLFLYADVDRDGKIGGEEVRELVKKTKARVAVVASENAVEHCRAVLGARAGSGVNLVVTVERKGETLSDFFEKVFHGMAHGRGMMAVWGELVPEMEGYDHPDAPRAVVMAEAGEVVFGKKG